MQVISGKKAIQTLIKAFNLDVKGKAVLSVSISAEHDGVAKFNIEFAQEAAKPNVPRPAGPIIIKADQFSLATWGFKGQLKP